MPAWVLRGLVLAAVHGVASVSVARIRIFYPDTKMILTWVVIALLVGVALAWGSVDGWLRRPDRGRTWVQAALLAGVGSGVLNVIGRALFVDKTSASELGVQLTSGAAFVALLVVVPAAVGMVVGSRLDRPPADIPTDDAAADVDDTEADVELDADVEPDTRAESDVEVDRP